MRASPVSLQFRWLGRGPVSRAIMVTGLLAAWSPEARCQRIVLGVGPDSVQVVRGMAPLMLPVVVAIPPAPSAASATAPQRILAALQATMVWDATRLRLDSLRTAPGSPLLLTVNPAAAPLGRVLFNAFGAVGMTASAAVALAYFTPRQPGEVTVALEVQVAGDEQGRPMHSEVRGRVLRLCLTAGGMSPACAR